MSQNQRKHHCPSGKTMSKTHEVGALALGWALRFCTSRASRGARISPLGMLRKHNIKKWLSLKRMKKIGNILER